jgi:hypothetical protein
MTVEIVLTSLNLPRPYDPRTHINTGVTLHPPRPYPPHSHMHTGPLIIATETPNFWRNPPRD